MWSFEYRKERRIVNTFPLCSFKIWPTDLKTDPVEQRGKVFLKKTEKMQGASEEQRVTIYLCIYTIK